MGSILSIDYGLKRIGIAVSDPGRVFSFPICVIENKNNKFVLTEMKKLIEEREVDLLVLGLPYNMDNSKGEMAEKVKGFSKVLEKEFKLEVKMVDERLTSFEAEENLKRANLKGKKLKANLDAEAARLILEEYLRNS